MPTQLLRRARNRLQRPRPTRSRAWVSVYRGAFEPDGETDGSSDGTADADE